MKPSGEMYLETIYVLSQRNPQVRSVDIAEHMNYSKPSVSRAVGLLKQDGYITLNENAHIALTDRGLDLARKIYERHTVLSKALMRLGVDEQTATEDACRIEHVISDQTMAAIKAHLESY